MKKSHWLIAFALMGFVGCLPTEEEKAIEFKEIETVVSSGGECRVDVLGGHIGLTGNRAVILMCGERGGLVRAVASDMLNLQPDDLVRTVVYSSSVGTQTGKASYAIFVEKKIP